MADCKEAVPSDVWSEKHVAFLKKKFDMISKLFLDSDIPPKLRVRPWTCPGRLEAAAWEQGTKLGWLWGVLWSLGLGGVGSNPPPVPEKLRTSMWIRVGEMGMILQHCLLEKRQG